MYDKILDIIYNYAFNSKLPDVEFIDSILSIIIDKDLIKYINKVDYSYKNIDLASYQYESGILKFNLNMIIDYYTNYYSQNRKIYHNDMNSFDKYLYMCLNVIEIVYHEIEHVIQNKKINTLSKDDFRRQLIETSFIAVEVYPNLYEKRHDLFSIEREANIRSCEEIKKILALCEVSPKSIKKNFSKRYNQLINKYYSKDNYPLLEFLTIIRGKLSYNNNSIEAYNTNEILTSTKADFSFNDRVLLGLPLDKKEYHKLKKIK